MEILLKLPTDDLEEQATTHTTNAMTAIKEGREASNQNSSILIVPSSTMSTRTPKTKQITFREAKPLL